MQTLPSDIRTGMTVYDSRHHAIGKVDDFKFSENELEPDVQPADIDGTDRRDARETILASIAEAFGREELPETLRDRLLTEGYIRLDTKGSWPGTASSSPTRSPPSAATRSCSTSARTI